MSPQFQQASFIPKKPLNRTPNASIRKRRRVNVFSTIAILLFVIAVLGSIGVFAYGIMLERSIEEKRVALEIASERVDDTFADEAKQTHAQLSTLKDQLDTHIAASALFALLESMTLRSVQLTSFSFEGGGSFSVSVSGTARDFSSLSLQADEFSENELVTESTLSNIALTETGSVTFDVGFAVDPGVVRYSNAFSE